MRARVVWAAVVLVLWVRPAMCAGAAAVAERVDYRGFRAIQMGNGIIDLWVVPDIGGRILQIRCRGHEYLYVNDALVGQVMPQVDESGEELPWNNYGGDKLWPAPQGPDDGAHWEGPPDPHLDGCRFSAEIIRTGGEEAVVRLTSPPSSDYWGIQFVRELSLRAGEARIISTTTMRNIVDRDVRWAIWQVTQHYARSDSPPYSNESLAGYVPAARNSRHPRGFWHMFGHRLNPAFSRPTPGDLIRAHYNRQVGKIGVDSDAGWLAVMNDAAGAAFTQVFDYHPDLEYTDAGSSVEFWINGVGTVFHQGERIVIEGDLESVPPLMESEVLSPWVKLGPGEEYTHRVVMGLGAGAGVPASATEWSLVLQPARAVSDGQMARFDANVVTHVPGRLAVIALDDTGREIARRQLAAGRPGTRKRVSVALAAPSATYVRLVLTGDPGGDEQTLITVPVTRHQDTALRPRTYRQKTSGQPRPARGVPAAPRPSQCCPALQ